MYKFSIYDFSEKEIEQICGLVKRWASGDVYRPIDGRCFTKQIKTWALGWDLLEAKNDRLYLTSYTSYYNVSGRAFNVRWNLPVEVLWRLIQPMLREDGATGYSIVNNPLWYEHLAIAPQNDRHATNRELEDKEDILIKLSSSHYINFQMAGTVWCIYREKAIA